MKSRNLSGSEARGRSKITNTEEIGEKEVKGLLKGAILLVLLSGFAAAQRHMVMANAADKKISTSPTWELKYKSGSLTLQKEQWLKGEFAKEATEKSMNPLVVVSRDQVRSISFDAKAEKNSRLLEGMPRSGCHGAKSLMPKSGSAPGPELFVIWVSTPGKMARAAEHLGARYPVRFAWSENGIDQELVLTVDYCEYAAFMANLRWFVGQRWKEIAGPGRATAKN
jgi:hypothetical protein